MGEGCRHTESAGRGCPAPGAPHAVRNDTLQPIPLLHLPRLICYIDYRVKWAVGRDARQHGAMTVCASGVARKACVPMAAHFCCLHMM